MIDTRDIVLSVLMDVENNRVFSNVAITKALRQNQFSEKIDRAFITRLAEGTIEYKIRIDYVINQFSKTKVNKCKPLIRCLLRMGVYQILFMDSVPDSAACNEAVKLAKKHGFASLSGFVNGVLRNISRNKNDIAYPSIDRYNEYLSVIYSMPLWLVDKLLKDYPDDCEKILKAGFEDRKTTIRVNTTKISVDDMEKILVDKNINVSRGEYNEKALRIDGYDFIRKVPGYREGYFTVQDESSMCAINAAGIEKDDVVLDVCAAPGGKTTAAAEILNGTGKIYSMDIAEEKLELIEENVKRLGFDNVSISQHDATIALGREEFADVVIADVLCSGLGIIGRKNDIKYKITEEQLDNLIEIQRKILDVVCRYVKDKGTLVYSTCTINPMENQENVRWFLQRYSMFELKEERCFVQGKDSCDGFYYAILRKK